MPEISNPFLVYAHPLDEKFEGFSIDGQEIEEQKAEEYDFIPIKDLKLNGIYCVLRPRSFMGKELVPIPFRYNGNRERPQKHVNYYREFECYEILSKHREKVRVIAADKDMRRRYWEGWENKKRQKETQKRLERRKYLKERKYKKKNPLEFLKPNTDLSTQLLSESLHELLLRFKDNPVAASLLRLNCLGFLGNSVRNITIRDSDKQMSYCPAGNPSLVNLTGKGTWNVKGRQVGKYGKILRKVIKEQVPRLKFKDQDIEKLVNHLKSEVAEGTFEVVEGDKIREWYDGSKYIDNDDSGTLGHSCMRDKNCLSYLKIYSDNPDTVKMIILTKKNQLVGRALLWKGKWMDRIYGSDSTIQTFIKYAKREGYNYKDVQNAECFTEWRTPEGDFFEENIKFNLETHFDEYPYADTFCCIDVEAGEIANYPISNVSMRETEGGLTMEDGVYDEIDERNIEEGDAVRLVGSEIITHYNNATRCAWSDHWCHPDDIVETISGEAVWDGHEEIVFVDHDRQYTRSDNVFNCEYDNIDYISSLHECHYIPELDMHVHSDNIKDAYEANNYHFTINGNWETKEEEQKV